MNTSPAFLAEVDSQLRIAEQELAAAAARGDESQVGVARNRIADLRDLQERVLEAPQTGSLRAIA